MTPKRTDSEPPSAAPSGAFPHLPDALNPVHHLRVVGRLIHRSAKKAGAAPGTLVHTGRQKVEEVRIRMMDYEGDDFWEREAATIDECFPFRDAPTVTWVNVDGLHDVSVVRKVGEHFGFHPLVLEDVLSVGQRPKVEEHDGYIFLVLRMLSYDEVSESVQDEQISLIVGENYVFSFQERPGDVFDPVRERIRNGGSRIRTRGPDYLAYALVDAVVDGYYGVLERVGNELERMDLQIMDDPGEADLHRIHEVKREMLVIRRAVWPIRDVMSHLLRTEHGHVTEETKVYLRDVYDHAIQVLDTVETFRDLASGLTDLYLSTVGQRTNEVMKVLTVMASIFIPLTFLAGVYGMNFEFMPELQMRWAYPAVLGFMLVVGLGMVWFFRRKGWL